MDATVTQSSVCDSTDPTPELPAPASSATVLATADLAECTCPDFCERDHGNE